MKLNLKPSKETKIVANEQIQNKDSPNYISIQQTKILLNFQIKDFFLKTVILMVI